MDFREIEKSKNNMIGYRISRREEDCNLQNCLVLKRFLEVNSAMKKAFALSLMIFFLLCLPLSSLAGAGSQIERLSAYRGETIVSQTPNGEVSVVYDGKDHGVSFKCISTDIYDKTYDCTSDATIDSCSVTDESGGNVDYTILQSSSYIGIVLTKPEVGTYSINVSASWSWYGKKTASAVITLTVQKAHLYDYFKLTSYSGTYDGNSHNAVTATVSSIVKDYTVEYKYGTDEYSTIQPQVKNVADSGNVYHCRVTTTDTNFSESSYERTASANITKKKATLTLSAQSKCLDNMK